MRFILIHSRNKAVDSVYEGVQGFFFKTHGTYFKKLYQHFKEYPLPEGEEQ